MDTASMCLLNMAADLIQFKIDLCGHCWDDCNRCGKWGHCPPAWPAMDGCYYGALCSTCRNSMYPKWEQCRLELVGRHSE